MNALSKHLEVWVRRGGKEYNMAFASGDKVSELEDILFSILKSEFKMIEYVGGILGFVIGLTQVAIIKLF